MKKTALVTGANRGIGFEVCKQLAQKGYLVILAARDLKKAESAAEELKSQGLSVDFCELDISSDSSVSKCAEWFRVRYGKLNALVNNAGVFLDSRTEIDDLSFSSEIEKIRKTLETNTYGAFRMIRAFAPLLEGDGRVVNVSSGMGALNEMDGGYAAYRISKTALNAVTRIMATEYHSKNILVNSVCPGWVKTDMGGAGAEREIPQGADGLVWLATLPKDGPTGGFFRDREKIDW